MPVVHRVLPAEPFGTLDAYRAVGGGEGLRAARRLGPAAVVEDLEAAGLRGRGGGGFPTATKWRTVAGNASPTLPTTVVVNGAEGEPGTFKDRAILRANPYAVLEGALIAALAVGADRAVVALKATFTRERARLEQAIAEAEAAGWTDGVTLTVATGPGEYLFGEETGLLEALEGRPPLPRLAAPYRHGADEVGREPGEPGGTVLASPGEAVAPPTLVNNVETLANVPRLIAEGPSWFRSVGTAGSPGTVVCTITGDTRRHGVVEVAMGTPLAEVIDTVGGGPRDRQRLTAALSGVANPLLPADRFGTPLTYEDLTAVGGGLGAAGFIVFDDSTDLVAVAAGVSHFLAVESCGQCTPCKGDGLALAELLDRLRRSEADDHDVAEVRDRLGTVANGARCYLATQHELVVASLLELFPDLVSAHLAGAAPAEAVPIVPIVDFGDDGRAVLDEGQLAKQPDWTFDDTDSGKRPAERLAEGGTDAP
jgi:NADH:ubiquinone oxidoreductase subunit F (NADH-binding)